MRNAVAHGIEPPALRRRQGKAAAGLVNIAWAERAEGGFALTVEDDGAGISLKRIRQRLVEQGMPDDQALALSDLKLMGQLFAPGFSTRQHADEDAGRGVGLDCVRVIARQLGGRIRLHSRLGELTRFTVHFPAAEPVAAQARVAI